ncbi:MULTISPECIES: fimbrial assembly chaperone [Klebsiella]|uniref:fimbrial assembly chaperone n=1 Tax=Klebsiella TaxID=570 RepID=UPI001BCBEC28|nr:fimbrial assembly chaperone [Klebsiella aerogenes]HBS5677775.1 fimbrial assembly chaperone [Klebsiella aerogenes]HCT4437014.1 fimbrial assembly chaperone [Klebsiella aerogenes]HCU2334824.1 fimbrial assembly chaperone [Klebsiella aerogenes]
MRSFRQWSAFSKALAFALLAAAGTTRPALAIVNVEKTRVIFAAGEMSQAITLSNDGETPMLLQTWSDKGDIAASPDSRDTPIVVLPPVFKMQPGELRSLRLMLTSRQILAADRESLFWLNLYQIPPNTKTADTGSRQVILPLRLRLKVFVRPANLKAPTPDTEQQLKFSVEGKTITIDNPTPWFMSISVQPGMQKSIDNLLIPPKSGQKIESSQPLQRSDAIRYSVIGDDGNARNYAATPQFMH